MTITLEPITVHNWIDAVKLNVREDQRHFVAANIYSIAQSKFHPTWEPTAIFAGGEMVGFVMWGLDDEKPQNEWWIIRLMIVAEKQRLGYGKAATLAVTSELRTRGAQEVFLSFEPGNQDARKFYEHLGFTDTGRVEDNEIVYCLALR